jgi:4a-hydroxytetrahydrobiopterin dehydratase
MREKLDPAALTGALTALPAWTTDGSQIKKSFAFATYKDGLVFAVAVGHLADRMDHHPDMFVGYRKVDIALSTHDAGGVTEFDIKLATQIESLT